MEERTVEMKGWLRSRRRVYLAALPVLFVFAFMPGIAAQAITPPDTLQNVRFGDGGSYERAVIDLGYAGTPGKIAPVYTSSYRDGDWLVRVKLPTVEAASKTGGRGLGKAISRYHVVRSAGGTGSMFVDLHLTGAAKSVNVFELDDPARIVVDVTPGGTALYPRPKMGAGTVVLGPRAGRMVGPGSFTVSGYGRPFEASGAWRVKDSSGKVVRRGIYTTSDWTAAWGAFGFSAAYPAGVSGQSGTLEVGEHSARDGSFRGVSVPLRFR